MSKRKRRDFVCHKCGNIFQAARSDAKHCKSCHKLRAKEWARSPHGRKRRSINVKDARLKVIKAYGGGCACCGETAYEFLAVDHINGDGYIERRSLTGQQIVKRLIRENFPQGYRILCHNCNCAIGFYGYCPHTFKRTA